MRQIASNSLLLGTTLFAAALVFAGCVVDSTENTTSDFSGSGGNTAGSSQAGTGGAAGAGAGGAGAAGAGAGGAGAGGAGAGGAAGTGGGGGAAGSAGGAGAGGSAPGADVRFAHLVSDLDPVDICVKFKGNTAWVGPIFSSNKAAGQFYYPGVSNYFQVDAGEWEIRLVATDAASCDTALSGFADQPLSFESNGSYTVAFDGSKAFTIKTTKYTDRGAPAAGQVGYQAFNALAETGIVTFGLNNEATGDFQPIAENIAPLAGVDGKGEFDPSKLRPAFITPAPAKLVAQGPAIDMGAGEIYAAFVHGTKESDPVAAKRPATVICRNFLTVDEKTANNEYAVEGNTVSTHCVYGPTGQ